MESSVALPRPSRRWRKHADVYRFFAENQCIGLNYSEQAAREAYAAESVGLRVDLSRNGYAVGKHWANVQVAEWRQGIREFLFLRREFVEAPEMAHIRWWVESVLQ